MISSQESAGLCVRHLTARLAAASLSSVPQLLLRQPLVSRYDKRAPGPHCVTLISYSLHGLICYLLGFLQGPDLYKPGSVWEFTAPGGNLALNPCVDGGSAVQGYDQLGTTPLHWLSCLACSNASFLGSLLAQALVSGCWALGANLGYGHSIPEVKLKQ